MTKIADAAEHRVVFHDTMPLDGTVATRERRLILRPCQLRIGALSTTPVFLPRIGRLGIYLLACLLAGCAGEPASPVPEVDFAGELSRLEQLHNQIRDGFAQNDAEGVHDALHDVGDALQNLALRAERDLDAAGREAAQQAATKMAELYRQLDESLHGGDEVPYDEVGDDLQGELDALRSLSAGP